MAAVRHIGFPVTSSNCIRILDTIVYIPNIVLNFHLDWFSSLLSDILEFHVSSFWLEIAYSGPNF